MSTLSVLPFEVLTIILYDVDGSDIARSWLTGCSWLQARLEKATERFDLEWNTNSRFKVPQFVSRLSNLENFSARNNVNLGSANAELSEWKYIPKTIKTLKLHVPTEARSLFKDRSLTHLFPNLTTLDIYTFGYAYHNMLNLLPPTLTEFRLQVSPLSLMWCVSISHLPRKLEIFDAPIISLAHWPVPLPLTLREWSSCELMPLQISARLPRLIRLDFNMTLYVDMPLIESDLNPERIIEHVVSNILIDDSDDVTLSSSTNHLPLTFPLSYLPNTHLQSLSIHPGNAGIYLSTSFLPPSLTRLSISIEVFKFIFTTPMADALPSLKCLQFSSDLAKSADNCILELEDLPPKLEHLICQNEFNVSISPLALSKPNLKSLELPCRTTYFAVPSLPPFLSEIHHLKSLNLLNLTDTIIDALRELPLTRLASQKLIISSESRLSSLPSSLTHLELGRLTLSPHGSFLPSKLLTLVVVGDIIHHSILPIESPLPSSLIHLKAHYFKDVSSILEQLPNLPLQTLNIRDVVTTPLNLILKVLPPSITSIHIDALSSILSKDQVSLLKHLKIRKLELLSVVASRLSTNDMQLFPSSITSLTIPWSPLIPEGFRPNLPLLEHYCSQER
jgi:hypothetical protein